MAPADLRLRGQDGWKVVLGSFQTGVVTPANVGYLNRVVFGAQWNDVCLQTGDVGPSFEGDFAIRRALLSLAHTCTCRLRYLAWWGPISGHSCPGCGQGAKLLSYSSPFQRSAARCAIGRDQTGLEATLGSRAARAAHSDLFLHSRSFSETLHPSIQNIPPPHLQTRIFIYFIPNY